MTGLRTYAFALHSGEADVHRPRLVTLPRGRNAFARDDFGSAVAVVVPLGPRATLIEERGVDDAGTQPGPALATRLASPPIAEVVRKGLLAAPLPFPLKALFSLFPLLLLLLLASSLCRTFLLASWASLPG